MQKVKLNSQLREQLKALARSQVHSRETETWLATRKVQVTKLVLRLVKQMYPPKEMKILLKHDVARPSHQFDLIVVKDNSSPNYDHWQLPHESDKERAALPLKALHTFGTKRRVRIEDKADVKVMMDYYEAVSAHTKAIDAKLDAFMLLITNARYLDQVEEVWPAAKKVRATIPQLPAVPLAPLQDQVRAILDADKNAKLGVTP